MWSKQRQKPRPHSAGLLAQHLLGEIKRSKSISTLSDVIRGWNQHRQHVAQLRFQPNSTGSACVVAEIPAPTMVKSMGWMQPLWV